MVGQTDGSSSTFDNVGEVVHKKPAAGLVDRVIMNEDLLYQIFEFVYRACSDIRKQFWPWLFIKNFTAVAASFLWRDLDSILPLVKLLPGVSWSNGEYSLEHSGTLSMPDMERWNAYSPKVRRIAVHGHRLTHTVLERLLHFTERFQPFSLLPALRAVKWQHIIDEDTLPFTSLFIQPSIERLIIGQNAKESTPESLERFLQIIVKSAPKLQVLMLWAPERSVRSLATLGQLQQLACLVLDLQYRDDLIDSFPDFFQVPREGTSITLHAGDPGKSLTETTIFSVSTTAGGGTGTYSDGSSSNSLHVELTGNSSDVVRWLRAASNLQFWKLEIDLKEGESDWEGIMECLLAGDGRRSVKDLECLVIRADADVRVPVEIVHGLAALDNLTTFEVAVQFSPSASSTSEADKFIEDLLIAAKSKRRPLEHLTLESKRLWRNYWPSMTALNFIPLHAKDLRTLRISLDTYYLPESVPSPADFFERMYDSDSLTTSGLQTLSIQEDWTAEAPTDKIRDLAMFLDTLFPKLSEAAYLCDSGDGTRRRDEQQAWDNIEHLRRCYQGMRFAVHGLPLPVESLAHVPGPDPGGF
ncbi:hypothetical protein FA15DRAFT_665439 [Coprinopsis marcescibilis]|uniref:Uncharacterized protein n=1 Tax=Coprinopsis marcescibilis TaxID=230819 RepID=A0A5C3L6R1_COPMA|nr:hypothetical protein FA15DRAFT_665439 [Coprinopsis marcescibilis]